MWPTVLVRLPTALFIGHPMIWIQDHEYRKARVLPIRINGSSQSIGLDCRVYSKRQLSSRWKNQERSWAYVHIFACCPDPVAIIVRLREGWCPFSQYTRRFHENVYVWRSSQRLPPSQQGTFVLVETSLYMGKNEIEGTTLTEQVLIFVAQL